jgi:sugar/nucleoside kinase (ribokinase family)
MSANSSNEHHRAPRRFDVTVVGDANLDLLFYGLPDELPCERELLASDMAIRIGGSGAITAHNLAALGNKVGFITTAPGDDFARVCQTELTDAGVDLSCCVSIQDDRTGVTVHLQHRELRHMFTYAGATFRLDYDHLDLAYLSDSGHFHMPSYYLQRALTPRIPELFVNLRKAGLSISLDPNDDPAHTWDRSILEALRYVNVLMPNEREACMLAGERDLQRAISVLREIVPLLVIKRGARGASAYRGDCEWHSPAEPIQVVDAVGAGDSFNAGFLHAWIRSWSIDRALAFGNLVGARSASQSGGTSAFRDRKATRALGTAWETPLPNVST